MAENFLLRIEPEMLERVRASAAATDRSVSAMFRVLVARGLEESIEPTAEEKP